MNMTDKNFLNEKELKELFKKFIITLLKEKNPTDIEELGKAIEKLRIPLSEMSSQNKMHKGLAEIINDMVGFLNKIVKFAWVLRVHRITIFIFLSAIIIAVLGIVFYFVGETNVGIFLIAICGILLGVAGILISIFSSAEQKFK